MNETVLDNLTQNFESYINEAIGYRVTPFLDEHDPSIPSTLYYLNVAGNNYLSIFYNFNSK